MKIVGIGACVMDTLLSVPSYPAEDTKMKASSSRAAGGGPTATGLVAARKSGADCAYIGVLSDDAGGQFLKKDFERFGVDTSLVTVCPGCRSFTSVIWLSGETASRTCVFDRGDLPKLTLNEEQKQAVRDADLLMVDGNELDGALEAAKLARESGTKVLYDCGGLYPNVEKLLALTDLMIPSEEFALKHTGCDNAKAAAEKLMALYHPQAVIVTRGKAGGLGLDKDGFWEYPAFPVKAVDTNGAGDVFHGAFAAATVRGMDARKACVFASAVSARKCTGVGARESTPTFDQTINFLKENGYEL